MRQGHERAIIFDCEFMVSEGAQRRFWCGPSDPDPVVVQIGAVKLKLIEPFDIAAVSKIFIRPVARDGTVVEIDPFFSTLTGIDTATVNASGVPLDAALASLDHFSEGAKFWSWGKDELNLLAIGCYVAGMAPPIPATRFDNACKLFLAAGMSGDDLARTRSSDLARHFGVERQPLAPHDGLNDALSITYAVQHLLRAGRLSIEQLR